MGRRARAGLEFEELALNEGERARLVGSEEKERLDPERDILANMFMCALKLYYPR